MEPNAQLNITYNGQNGDYPDPVDYDASNEEIKRIAAEGLSTGYVPGITMSQEADFDNFVVDRYPASEAERLPPRLMLRPKAVYGIF